MDILRKVLKNNNIKYNEHVLDTIRIDIHNDKATYNLFIGSGYYMTLHYCPVYPRSIGSFEFDCHKEENEHISALHRDTPDEVIAIIQSIIDEEIECDIDEK